MTPLATPTATIVYAPPTLAEAEHARHTYKSIRRHETGPFALYSYLYVDEGILTHRNLRGVVFDTRTGEVASLPFHKFFNLNEQPFTAEDALDFHGRITEKEDGSMVQITWHAGEWLIGSRMSLRGYVTSTVTALLKEPRYQALLAYMRARPSVTFLFEVLDPHHTIVLSHKLLELVFLNARDKLTGAYEFDAHAESIPCRVTDFNELTPASWVDLKERLRLDENREGVVLLLRSGELVKVKTIWYSDIHHLATTLSETSVVRAWADGSADDAASILRSNGLKLQADILTSSFVRLEVAARAELDMMLRAARNCSTPKEAIVALGGPSSAFRRLLTPHVMRAFRREDLSLLDPETADWILGALKETVAVRRSVLREVADEFLGDVAAPLSRAYAVLTDSEGA